MKTNSDQAIAEFLAKGGRVTRVAEGARTMNERQMYAAVRGDDQPYDPRLRLAAVDHRDREIWVNEDGEFHSFG